MNKVGKTKGYKKSKQDIILDFFIYTFSLIILFLTIYPFFYVIILSFNEGVDASFGGIYWWPRKFTLENYAKFFNDLKWLKGIGITVLRTVIGTVLGVLFTTLVSYACSFKDLIGRKYYMIFIIICMYFSGGIIPYYAVLRSLHLIDTFGVYVIPGMLNLFFIMIGRGFFEGIPASLRESAKIDGATEFTIFKKIILPISKPFVATLALFIGVGHWNNWYVIEILVDVVSKNGSLLLNILQKPDGTLDEETEYVLEQIGSWLKYCGEGIYGTRPWKIYGEGNSKVIINGLQEDKVNWTEKDIRYTCKDNHVFAFIMGKPESNRISLKSFKNEDKIQSVKLLGGMDCNFTQDSTELQVALPNQLPTKLINCLKITLKR